ncbi:hypothetical protein G7Y89_g8923 [Cudoniella acicularis]|uniref:Uncharacterized protein n=1 Tax=Cudoniella acicularis TaxID=354080 RepID=A0A8H4RH85_9HELO|nr:hypothetical protein G7Y89_g8923 [Cudoniella acicularis]
MDIISSIAPIAIEEAVKYVSKQTTSDSSLLATEAASNNTKSMKTLLDKNPRVDRGPALVAAAAMGNLSALNLLLEDQSSSSHRHSHRSRHEVNLNVWSSGNTPLLAAVKGKHVKTTRLLLQAGADPELCPKTGDTALHQAARGGDIDMVEELLAFDAEVDHRNSNGDTPLITAARNQHARTAKVLIDNGADIEAVNKKGGSALLVAARHDCLDVVRLLLKEGADVNVRDKKGRGVLHRAVEGLGYNVGPVGAPVSIKVEILELLLKAGADPKMKDDEGKTPADGASWLSGGDRLRNVLLNWKSDRRRRVSQEHRRGHSKDTDQKSRSMTF